MGIVRVSKVLDVDEVGELVLPAAWVAVALALGPKFARSILVK